MPKTTTKAPLNVSPLTPEKRIDRADELLARLVADIGPGPALDQLRKDALRIKHVLRGLDW
jgi:hypothetical protein